MDSDDDTPDTSGSEITRNLAAGNYTIEATTYAAGETGSFTLTVSGLSIAGGTQPADGVPVATALAPLGSNLLWILHFDATRSPSVWSVYDPSGTFSSSQNPFAPGSDLPDPSSVELLTHLVPGEIYGLTTSEKQTVTLGGVELTLYPGSNAIVFGAYFFKIVEATEEAISDSAEVFASLGDRLVRVWYLDRAAQAWSFYDPDPAFAEFNSLTEVSSGQIVTIIVSGGDPIEFNSSPSTLYQGTNPVALEPGSGSIESDRAALVVLYNTAGGTNWVNNSGWLSDAPLGEWSGIETDDNGRVVGVDLRENSLSGTIPGDLGNLSSLQWLFLNNEAFTCQETPCRATSPTANRLTGTIPPELGQLANLELLYLALNPLTGEIPSELADLVRLKALGLWISQLSGDVPSWLGDLVDLETLNLAVNNFSGPIPVELGNLTNLNELTLSVNQLTGTIPASLGNLTGLNDLGLDSNRFTGSIPASLGNLSNLNSMYISANELSGCIPAGLRRVPRKRLRLIPTALLQPVAWCLGLRSAPVRRETSCTGVLSLVNVVSGVRAPSFMSQLPGFEVVSKLGHPAHGRWKHPAVLRECLRGLRC